MSDLGAAMWWRLDIREMALIEAELIEAGEPQDVINRCVWALDRSNWQLDHGH